MTESEPPSLTAGLNVASSLGPWYFYAGSENCASGHAWGGIRDHWLFHLVHRGRGRVRLAGSVHNLEKGQGFLVPPNTEVSYVADREDPWSYSWFACSGPQAASCFQALGLGRTAPWYTTNQEPLYRPGGDFQTLTARLAQDGDGFLLTAGLYGLFACLRRGLGDPGPGVVRPQDLYASLVDDFIRTHFSRHDARIEAWATQIGLSRKHLSEVVKARSGASPRALLTSYRLERARDLLATTGLSVGAVAASVGYGDPLAFSRAFRGRFGVPPRLWRTRWLNPGPKEAG